MRQDLAKISSSQKSRALLAGALAHFLALCLAVPAEVALARPFSTRLESMRPSLKLPVNAAETQVAPTMQQIERRVQSAASDSRVEPLYLAVPVEDDERAALALKLARPKKYRQLMGALDAELLKAGDKVPEAGVQNNQVNPANPEEPAKSAKIRVTPELFALMSPAAVIARLQRGHLRVSIDSAQLQQMPELRNELLTQLAPFSASAELRRVADKLRLGSPLDVDADILPPGPRRAIRTFEMFRGPNCFMTALAFQYPKMVRSQLVNIKAERDHHEVMINNDELWRVLQSSFYEVDPARSPLKFGDLLVFFQVPSALKSPTDADVSYRWIKHATTYLFNDFVYSKGSKSPNSPYVVGTLRSEWRAWEKHVAAGGGNLGVKVFRKPLKSATSRPPKSLEDWMY